MRQQALLACMFRCALASQSAVVLGGTGGGKVVTSYIFADAVLVGNHQPDSSDKRWRFGLSTGRPAGAGWGLSDDAQRRGRRTRTEAPDLAWFVSNA
jgi:hypothetical protein